METRGNRMRRTYAKFKDQSAKRLVQRLRTLERETVLISAEANAIKVILYNRTHNEQYALMQHGTVETKIIPVQTEGTLEKWKRLVGLG